MLRKMLKKTRAAKKIDWEENLEELPSHFLDRRQTHNDKYQESSLQKLYISLRNEKV